MNKVSLILMISVPVLVLWIVYQIYFTLKKDTINQTNKLLTAPLNVNINVESLQKFANSRIEIPPYQANLVATRSGTRR